MQLDPSRTTPYPAVLSSAPMGMVLFAGVCLAVALVFQLTLGLTPFYSAKCVALFPLLGLLVVNIERTGLGPADLVTLGRAAVTAWVLGFIGEPLAVAIPTWLWFGAGLAFVLDAFDGWVARQTRSSSAFGAALDMELDGLTVFGLAALLWWMDKTGPWVLGAGALRYLFIAAGWAFPWMNAPLFPTPRRAWVCGIQLTLCIFALLPWPYTLAAPLLAGVGLLTLTGSFATDAWWLFRNRP